MTQGSDTDLLLYTSRNLDIRCLKINLAKLQNRKKPTIDNLHLCESMLDVVRLQFDV